METIGSVSVVLGGVVLVAAVSSYRVGAMVSGAEMLLSVRARLTCRGMWCWGLL